RPARAAVRTSRERAAARARGSRGSVDGHGRHGACPRFSFARNDVRRTTIADRRRVWGAGATIISTAQLHQIARERRVARFRGGSAGRVSAPSGKAGTWASARAFPLKAKEFPMPRGDKSSYTDKQKRKAEHIEEGYEHRGVGKKEAE